VKFLLDGMKWNGMELNDFFAVAVFLLVFTFIFVVDIVVSDLRDTRSMTGTGYTAEGHQAFHDLYVTSVGNDTANDRPHGWFFTPIFAHLGESTAAAAVAAASTGRSIDPDAPVQPPGPVMVGMLTSVIAFDNYLSNLLPDGIEGIHLVLTNNCNNSVTYELTGSRVSL